MADDGDVSLELEYAYFDFSASTKRVSFTYLYIKIHHLSSSSPDVFATCQYMHLSDIFRQTLPDFAVS